MSVWSKVRAYKQYIALILIPYLFLILIFHTQLTVYDGRPKEDDQDTDGVNSIFAAGTYYSKDSHDGELTRDTPLGHGHANMHREMSNMADTVKHNPRHHHTLRFSAHQRKNLEVAPNEPIDDRIPIPQITAQQLGSKGRSLGAIDIKKANPESIGVYNIDWNAQQTNYLDTAAELESDHQQDNRIELTWKHSSWVSNNKTTNKGSHDGIMMEHCQQHNGRAQKQGDTGIYPRRQEAGWSEAVNARQHGAQPGPIHPLTFIDHSRFQPLLHSYAYTAFYDDRQSGPAYVRIITLLKKTEKPTVFCHFPHHPTSKASTRSGKHSGPKYETVKATYYEMCENHGKDYGGWIASCQVPSIFNTFSPCEVTLSIHRIYPLKHKLTSDRTKSVTIPIYTLQNPKVKKADFGVCIPPLFGYIPTTTLIEFIELTKLLGADHLTFYAHQTPREVQKVLHYYEDKGDITVINWDLPVNNKDIWYHGQLLAINDCLNRNMHKFKYLAFNDIDEFFVPHQGKHFNWTEMMKDIVNASRDTSPHLHAGYVFQSAFFDPLMDLNTRGLYDLESDLRTKAFSKVRTKVLVHAERVYELGIHHISKPVREQFKVIDIEPNVAFLHHYRKCITDFDPRMNCQVFARDESLSRYIPTLRHNVHQVLWTLKEEDKKLLGNVFVR